MQAKKWTYLILGLGQTGISCARYLAQKNIKFALADSRRSVDGLEEFLVDMPEVDVILGGWSLELLLQAETLVISPGISLQEKSIAKAISLGVDYSSDVEIFLRAVNKPVIGVTGSNGKSTVVTLLGEMAKAANINVPVAGNIGLPVLDLLDANYQQAQANKGGAPQAYIVELSSFQLERLDKPKFDCACVLNISEDHMDRYADLDDYIDAKKIIFSNAKACVSNRQDQQTSSSGARLGDAKILSFGADDNCPSANDFGLVHKVENGKSKAVLMQGDKVLIASDEIKLQGQHNLANALAALAIVHALRWPIDLALNALKDFKGLVHRCQFVARYKDVTYINDSKGTNVGATLAAIYGLCAAENKRLVLIAGGEGKGADFSELKPALKEYGRAAVLIGKDAPLLNEVLADSLTCVTAESMKDAVEKACELAQAGDFVVLSPACASFDMFRNFEHRGDVFVRQVNALKESVGAPNNGSSTLKRNGGAQYV